MPRRKSSHSNVWESEEGWKSVEIDDDFLLGSEEAGFMALEELDPAALGKPSLGLHLATAHAAYMYSSQV